MLINEFGFVKVLFHYSQLLFDKQRTEILNKIHFRWRTETIDE